MKGGTHPVRLKIGRCPPMLEKDARREATKILSGIASGVDPRAEKANAGAEAVPATLGEAVEAYVEARQDSKQPTTLSHYRWIIDRHLKPYRHLKLADITPMTLQRIYTQIGKRVKPGRDRSGAATAITVFAFLRAVWRSIQAIDLDLPDWPSAFLKGFQHKPRTRTERLKRDQIQPFHAAMKEAARGNRIAYEYLLALMLLGLRNEEVARLTWQDLDLQRNTVTIRRLKQGRKLETALPPMLREELTRPWQPENGGQPIERWQFGNRGFVFPSTKAGSGHVENFDALLARVAKAIGQRVRLHDLRRTWVSQAREAGVDDIVRRRLIGHAAPKDAHESYDEVTDEQLQAAAAKISDHYRRLTDAGTVVVPLVKAA